MSASVSRANGKPRESNPAAGGRKIFENMQYAIFSVPTTCGNEEQETMNKFLRSHKVVKVDKELVQEQQQCYWSFCITYLQSASAVETSSAPKEKVDYKEVLREESFDMFTKLRAIRKKIASEDAVPAYAVFTDAELAQMTELKPFEAAKLKTISGIGTKKVEKYGKLLVDMYNNEGNTPSDEKSGESD